MAKVQLSYAYLVDVYHQAIQTQVLDDQKRRATSCKSLHKRSAISVADARKKRNDCDLKEHNNAFQKAKTAINCYVNKAKKKLRAWGIQARENKKDRKKRL